MRARIFCFLFLSWNEERRAPPSIRAREREEIKGEKRRETEKTARARTYLKIAVSLSVINPDGNCSSRRRSLTRCFLSLSFLAAHREESLLLRALFLSSSLFSPLYIKWCSQRRLSLSLCSLSLSLPVVVFCGFVSRFERGTLTILSVHTRGKKGNEAKTPEKKRKKKAREKNKNKKIMSVAGIDFGSKSNVVALARRKGIDVVMNEESKRETPSLINFGDKCVSLSFFLRWFFFFFFSSVCVCIRSSSRHHLFARAQERERQRQSQRVRRSQRECESEGMCARDWRCETWFVAILRERVWMREREAAKKTKLSSFRFFFDQKTFAKKRGRKRNDVVSFLSSVGDKKEKKKKFSFSLSFFFVTHTHTHREIIFTYYTSFTDTIFSLSFSLSLFSSLNDENTGNDSLDARLAIRSTCNRRTRWRAWNA